MIGIQPERDALVVQSQKGGIAGAHTRSGVLQKPEGRRGLLPASRPALGDYLLLKRRHGAEVLTDPKRE